jgi:peptidoglycan biosynthesis protein MviN/MurJ (putative lipid II flippase)
MVATFLKTALITFLVFISPIKGLIYLISFAVAFDTIFAIYVSVKQKGVNSFRSTKLFNIVVKTFFYMGSIVFAYLLDCYIFEGKIFDIPNLISKVITFVWVYIEVKSIDETSIKLGNKSLWVLFKELISKAKDVKNDIKEIKE